MSTLSATAQNDVAGVQLVLSWDDAEHPPTVSRLDPDGQWRPVRGGNPVALDGSGSWSVVDREPALDVPVTYSAASLDGDGVEQSVDAEPVVVLSFGNAWLRHLAQPGLSQVVFLTEAPDLKRKSASGLYSVLGRRAPVATTDVRQQPAGGTLTLYTGTKGQRDALLRLLDDGTVLHLAMPGSSDVSFYVLPGDLTEQRVTHYGPSPERLWQLGFDVVDRPA